MTNERLRSQLVIAGVSIGEVATHLEVDPKTVERWVGAGRVPHRRHRWALAHLLDADEGYLWPAILEQESTSKVSQSELEKLYPHRGLVPSELWTTLINEAKESIDILVYAGLFLVDTHPDLPQALVDRANAGCKIRLLLGDPDSQIVAERGDEEGIGADLAARIRMTLHALRDIVDAPGIDVRQHGTILYNSIYRSDSQLLSNVHVYGAPATQNPVLHLLRVPGGRLFDHYMRGYDRVWDTAVPLEPRT